MVYQSCDTEPRGPRAADSVRNGNILLAESELARIDGLEPRPPTSQAGTNLARWQPAAPISSFLSLTLAVRSHWGGVSRVSCESSSRGVRSNIPAFCRQMGPRPGRDRVHPMGLRRALLLEHLSRYARGVACAASRVGLEAMVAHRHLPAVR